MLVIAASVRCGRCWRVCGAAEASPGAGVRPLLQHSARLQLFLATQDSGRYNQEYTGASTSALTGS